MIDDATNNQPIQREAPNRRHQSLSGKDVLIIGSDTAVLQDLVAKLAMRGANIALLCWQIPAEIAREMQTHVQSVGQQLILIQRAENQHISVENLIHGVITRWGRIDIFIDLLSKKRVSAASDHQQIEINEPKTAWSSPKWQLTWAVLEEMAHA